MEAANQYHLSMPDERFFHQVFTMGKEGSTEMVGSGFMRKPEVRFDHIDFDAPNYSLCYLIQGKGKYHFQGKVYDLKPGSIFQRIPGYRHSTEVTESPPWVEYFIEIGPKVLDALITMGLIQLDHPCAYIGLSKKWLHDFSSIMSIMQNRGEPSAEEVLGRAFQLIVDLLSISKLTYNTAELDMINQARMSLSNNLEQRLNIKTLCSNKGWNYDKLRKLFKRITGLSPAQYRIRRRMDEACHLIQATPEKSLQDFADALGYPTVYEFSSQFKQHIGQPPGSYRKHWR